MAEFIKLDRARALCSYDHDSEAGLDSCSMLNAPVAVLQVWRLKMQ